MLTSETENGGADHILYPQTRVKKSMWSIFVFFLLDIVKKKNKIEQTEQIWKYYFKNSFLIIIWNNDSLSPSLSTQNMVEIVILKW